MVGSTRGVVSETPVVTLVPKRRQPCLLRSTIFFHDAPLAFVAQLELRSRSRLVCLMNLSLTVRVKYLGTTRASLSESGITCYIEI